MPSQMKMPKLYAILDVACFAPPLRTTASIVDYARDLVVGGVTWLQYRNKVGNTREMLSHAREIRRALGNDVTLIMNDRADICIAADYAGVHVGQDDLSPEGARTVIGPAALSASPPTISSSCGSGCRSGGLHRLWSGVRYLLEEAPRSHRRPGGDSGGAGGNQQNSGGYWRHLSCQCTLGDRRRG